MSNEELNEDTIKIIVEDGKVIDVENLHTDYSVEIIYLKEKNENK